MICQASISRYLCEVMGTSQPNLLMEEAALMAMMESQAEIRYENVDTKFKLSLIYLSSRSALRTSLTPEEGIRRIRRSAPNIDRALNEAAQVEKVCSAQFPYCKISRIDILRLQNNIYSTKNCTYFCWNHVKEVDSFSLYSVSIRRK